MTKKDNIRKAHDYVYELFQGRCAFHLSHTASAIHEIIPRSRYPGKDWETDTDNMIPLCTEIHERVHLEGTRNWEDKLIRVRAKALRLMKSYSPERED